MCVCLFVDLVQELYICHVCARQSAELCESTHSYLHILIITQPSRTRWDRPQFGVRAAGRPNFWSYCPRRHHVIRSVHACAPRPDMITFLNCTQYKHTHTHKLQTSETAQVYCALARVRTQLKLLCTRMRAHMLVPAITQPAPAFQAPDHTHTQ